MQEKLLFVTKGGEGCDEGFSYVLELAKILNSGIAVLMVYNKKAVETYEDAMAAVAFAEAGELETVKELMQGQKKKIKEMTDKKIKEMAEKYGENPTGLIYEIAVGDTTSVIRDFLKDRPGIEMVLLSPNLSSERGFREIKKLIKNISKPIVTIRPAKAEA